MQSVALIARDGSIDWCCLPRMDSPSVFGAILDAGKGGCFRTGPVSGGQGSQKYIQESNVLVTSFAIDDAVLTVTDLMPLEGDINGRNISFAPAEVHPLVKCRGNGVEVEVRWCPRFDYARQSVDVERTAEGWIARAGQEAMRLLGLENAERTADDHGPLVRA
ncbi:MAG: hypothetical protein EA399_07105 [Desulfovibrionales bacterium]|nr:MAG: hypothetical protein EA399_07105 [Desulfovibrionales bacterium]